MPFYSTPTKEPMADWEESDVTCKYLEPPPLVNWCFHHNPVRFALLVCNSLGLSPFPLGMETTSHGMDPSLGLPKDSGSIHTQCLEIIATIIMLNVVMVGMPSSQLLFRDNKKPKTR